MGVYLNSSNAFTLYKNETSKPYFVDKTLILKELIPMVQEGAVVFPSPDHTGLGKRL